MLDDYLKELQHITLLQPDEERALWQAYKDEGNLEARSRLIEQYQPLVFKEAMRWHIHRDILSDALQEGTLGLIEAVERYDYRRGVAFPLFAVHRIRGAILDYLKRAGAVSAVSLDEPDERGVTLQDTLCDERQDPVEATSRQLLLEKVGHVLKRLPEKPCASSSSASQLPEPVVTTTGMVLELPTFEERSSSSSSKPFISGIFRSVSSRL